MMRPETRKSMEMLFHAKWNLPKAAKNANLTDKEMKITFNELFARRNLSVFKAFRRASAHCNGSVGTAKEKLSRRAAVYFASHADVQRWLIQNRRERNFVGRAPVVMPGAARATGH